MKFLKVASITFIFTFCYTLGFFAFYHYKEPSSAIAFPIEPAKTFSVSHIDVDYHTLSHRKRVQVDCLAENMYHEAKNQGYDGMLAVGLVTMNRVNSGKFPEDVCSVIRQKKGKVCQFSWYCSRVKLNKESPEYLLARRLAVKLLVQPYRVTDITGGALFFHADYVRPSWSNKFIATAQIGNHIFYTYNEAQ